MTLKAQVTDYVGCCKWTSHSLLYPFEFNSQWHLKHVIFWQQFWMLTCAVSVCSSRWMVGWWGGGVVWGTLHCWHFACRCLMHMERRVIMGFYRPTWAMLSASLFWLGKGRWQLTLANANIKQISMVYSQKNPKKTITRPPSFVSGGFHQAFDAFESGKPFLIPGNPVE